MIGQAIGPYQVLSKLGEGGMGEVYRARDAKLNRDVAIKVLPEAFALDADRLARFTREAQVLAALNHSNIAAIYGIEKNALVMELVEGDDLAAHIARGQMPLTDALPIARQIADALEAAHESGIVHRDLKPQNIKVRADGTVKVLDFGLAKAMDPGTSGPLDSRNSPTMTARATQMGMIIGTAAYMAPEQARGKAVDKRADIWAFGVVLYEMLTGRRAFEGEDISVTLANVIKEDPKWAALPSDVPPPIRRLLRRCLEKDPRKRLSAAGDARLELDEALSPAGEAALTAPSSRARERWWMAVAAASVTAAVALAVLLWPRPAVPVPPVVFTIDEPAGQPFYGSPRMMALSPDGTQLAFVAGSAAHRQLWIRSLESLDAKPLAGTEDAAEPAWSPDGRSVAFVSSRSAVASTQSMTLKRVDLAGGRVVELAPNALDAPAWSASGVILFTGPGRKGLYQVSDRGGEPQMVTELDASLDEVVHHSPVFLSDGRRFLYCAVSKAPGKGRLYLASLDAPGRTPIVDVTSSVAYAGGYLVYQRDGELMAQPFDATAGRVTGDAVSIINGVAKDRFGRAAFSVSTNGGLVYRMARTLGLTTLTWFDATGKAVGIVDGPARNMMAGRLSRDRTRVVVPRNDGRSTNLWIVEVARGVPARLTFDPGVDHAPVWSADSQHVIYRSDRQGRVGVYRRGIDGTSNDELLFDTPMPDTFFPQSLSADGASLFFSKSAPGGWDLWVRPIAGDQKPVPVITTAFNDFGGVLSPDGRWLAYSSDKGGNGSQVYVRSYPEASQELRVSSTTGYMPGWWSSDGGRLYYTTEDFALTSADITVVGGRLTARTPVQLFRYADLTLRDFGFDPVGPRFLLMVPADGASGSVPLTIELNWMSRIRK